MELSGLLKVIKNVIKYFLLIVCQNDSSFLNKFSLNYLGRQPRTTQKSPTAIELKISVSTAYHGIVEKSKKNPAHERGGRKKANADEAGPMVASSKSDRRNPIGY